MNDYIAYCGLDCEACEARIATVNNDEAMKVKVAEKWSEWNGVKITPEMINCVGCKIPGVKFPFCESMCNIKKCAEGKKFATCGSCSEFRSCEKLSMITGTNPDILKRLEEIATSQSC
ncbi:MAG: DUF3795 domain-containing protein [Treponema sp.]|nr:DUF3795 domain-containing protein [Treponema sp.]MBQ1662246.1 DUF3795 domain-containing protein [Treponema sp.]